MNTTIPTPDTDHRPLLHRLAESEVRRLRQTIDDVSQLQASGLIDEEQALRIVGLHWDAGKSSLLMIRQNRPGRPSRGNRAGS